MSVARNRRYIRRFADPRTRPSNERTDPVLEYTRWRVEQVGRFIDELEAERGGPVAAAAELILRNHAPRARRAEPGE